MSQRENPIRPPLSYRESRHSSRSQTPSYSSSKPPGYTGPRNLVLCFDGTANRPDSGHGTNVGILFQSLDKHTDKQVCYYQPGIGMSRLCLYSEFFINGLVRHVHPSDERFRDLA